MRQVVLLVLVGCSSNVPPLQDPSSAEQSVLQLEAGVNAMAASDGNGALTAVLAFLGDGTAVTGYATSAAPPSYATTTASCMPQICTFQSMVPQAPPGQVPPGPNYALDGTLSAQGDLITISLSAGIGGDSMFDRGFEHWSIAGSVTLSGEVLDGSVMLAHKTGIAGVPESFTELDYTLAYHLVRLASQCPVSGTLTATTTGSVMNASTTKIDVEQAGTFGPCGSVH